MAGPSVKDAACVAGPSRKVHRIGAGDFDLTPFSRKLAKLAHATGLRRHGTFLASWPSDFASGSVRIGPDHRPVIADIVRGKGIAA
jgi:hypothetical protein